MSAGVGRSRARYSPTLRQLQSNPGGTYELTGKVVPGSIQHAGDQLEVADELRRGVRQAGGVRIVPAEPQPGEAAGVPVALLAQCPAGAGVEGPDQASHHVQAEHVEAVLEQKVLGLGPVAAADVGVRPAEPDLLDLLVPGVRLELPDRRFERPALLVV